MNRRDLIKTLGAGGATLAMSGCLEGGRGMAPAGLSPRAAAAGAPRGLHVSLGNDAASTRSVTWFHDGTEPPAGAMLEFDAVLPGMDAAQIQTTPMNLRAPAQADPTPGVEAWTLRATAENIDPERPLRYRVGSQATGWSPVQVVAPTPSGAFRFTHFGDHGISARAQALSMASAAVGLCVDQLLVVVVSGVDQMLRALGQAVLGRLRQHARSAGQEGGGCGDAFAAAGAAAGAATPAAKGRVE